MKSKNPSSQLVLDFHVSQQALPGNGEDAMMTASSGLKLSESSKSSGLLGSFLKTFLGSSAFWSREVSLKWKPKRFSFLIRVVKKRQLSEAFTAESLQQSLKSSKQQDIIHRNIPMAHQSFFVFQLVPYLRRTAGIESGLLLTPTQMLIEEDSAAYRNRMKKAGHKNGNNNNLAAQIRFLLPTLRANSMTGKSIHGQGGQDIQTIIELLPTLQARDFKGKSTFQNQVDISSVLSLIPTLVARDFKGVNSQEHLDCGNHLDQLPNFIKAAFQEDGQNTGFRLSCAFAEWMMGYPEGWTDIEAEE